MNVTGPLCNGGCTSSQSGLVLTPLSCTVVLVTSQTTLLLVFSCRCRNTPLPVLRQALASCTCRETNRYIPLLRFSLRRMVPPGRWLRRGREFSAPGPGKAELERRPGVAYAFRVPRVQGLAESPLPGQEGSLHRPSCGDRHGC